MRSPTLSCSSGFCGAYDGVTDVIFACVTGADVGCTKTAAREEHNRWRKTGAPARTRANRCVVGAEPRAGSRGQAWPRDLIGQRRLLRIEVVRHAGRDAEHEEGGEDGVGLKGSGVAGSPYFIAYAATVVSTVSLRASAHAGSCGRVRDDRRRIVVLLRGAALAEGVELVEVPGRRVELVERPAVREGDAQRGDADGRVAEEREPRLQRDEEREVRRVEEEVVPAVQRTRGASEARAELRRKISAELRAELRARGARARRRPTRGAAASPTPAPSTSGCSTRRRTATTSPIANSHSKTDEKWIAQVGTDSAFTGSAPKLGSAPATSAGSAPTPPMKASCACSPSCGPANALANTSAARPSAGFVAGRSSHSSKPPCGSPAIAPRKPKATSRFDVVSSASAAPCSQSTSASRQPYTDFETMPVTTVDTTKSSRNWKPKKAVGGVPFFSHFRK